MAGRSEFTRIALIVTAMGSGGTERVVSIMANYWADHGKHVDVITLEDSESFYPLQPSVAHTKLGIASQSNSVAKAVIANITRLRALARTLRTKRPEAVISFAPATNVLSILACRRLGIPVAVSEQSVPHRQRLGIWGALRRAIYPFATRIVTLTEGARDDLPKALRHRTVVIPNAVAIPSAEAESEVNTQNRTIVAMGRLVPLKRFDFLLSAFKLVSDKFPQWRLAIYGDGPERRRLEQDIDRLNLRGNATLAGVTESPEKVMRGASFLAMSSSYEGFSMVALEAMACGLPVVAVDCPYGPRSIIRDGVDGVLVKDDEPASLATAMAKLMSDDALRARLASRAPEVLDRYALGKVMELWEACFDGGAR